MKFDVVVGNPPYKGLSALHQRFFNKGFSLLSPSGVIAFVQLATPYLNKNSSSSKQADKDMQQIVRTHAVSVQIADGSIFDGVEIAAKLVITVASKEKNSPEFTITYRDSGFTEVTTLSGVNQLGLPSSMHLSLCSKYETLVKTHGSLQDLTKKKGAAKAFLPRIRGHIGNNNDFNTLIPAKNARKHYTFGEHAHGCALESPDHLDNFYDYCETNFARMALALLKFSTDVDPSKLYYIPIVDFSRTYTDQELYDMAGFTQEEIQVIENTLPDYYNRKR